MSIKRPSRYALVFASYQWVNCYVTLLVPSLTSLQFFESFKASDMKTREQLTKSFLIQKNGQNYS